MLVSLCWVPRGAPLTKLPHAAENENEQIANVQNMDTTREASSDVGEGSDGGGNDSVQKSPEVDIGEVLANELDSLAFHKPGDEDPYLNQDTNANVLFDEEELDDLNIRPTDSLIITANSGEDAASLQVHVFDDDPDASDSEDPAYEPHTYVHHDLVLPTLPLCTAYTRLSVDGELTNLVAVGMFTPGIDIWDVDRVNDLEPLISLGGYDVSVSMSNALAEARTARKGGKGRRKRKSKPTLVEGSHRDAVMSLSWNNVQHEYLASGSADTTVKIWDIESHHCATTLKHHTDKVQAVAFHPDEAHLLATGAFDKTLQIVDVRAPDLQKQKWPLSADVETVCWGAHANDGLLVATLENGEISVFDPRMSGDSALLMSWVAHDNATSACSVSCDVSGLMVTGSIDKSVKVWDLRSVRDRKPVDLVYDYQPKSGSLFTLSLCSLPNCESNASPFVIAYGGSKGSLKVEDLAVKSSAVRERFLEQCQVPAVKSIESRSVRKQPKGSSELEDVDDKDSSDQNSNVDASMNSESALSDAGED